MVEGTQGSVTGAETGPSNEMSQQASRANVIVVVVALILMVALGFGGYQLFVHPDWAEVLRDIFIILMAVESLAIGILLIVLVVQIINLTKLLREEVLPILNSTNQTVDTVKQTTGLVSDVVVSPLIKAVTTVSAVRGGLRAIFGRSHSGNDKKVKPEKGIED